MKDSSNNKMTKGQSSLMTEIAWSPQVVGLSQVVNLIISTLSADLAWGQVRSTWTISFKRRTLVTTASVQKTTETREAGRPTGAPSSME